jgi:phosphatidylglycerophosphate synthase
MLERSERLILIFVGLLFAPFSIAILMIIIIILAVLTNITAMQRIYKALKSRRL